MWRYPAQQGKRTTEIDAKTVLKKGDDPQTVYNAKKKLRIVAACLKYAVAKKCVDPDVLLALEFATEGPKSNAAGGYLAYSTEELQAIFESAMYANDECAHAYEHWAPHIGLCTGARVRSA